MANELALFHQPNNAVAAAFATNDFTATLASDSMKRISIKGGVFRRLDGKQEIDSIDDRFLRVVVVGASPAVQREFYDGVFQEGVEAAPACFSNNGNTPDAGVPKPQAQACNACPKNQPGSGQDGKTRACRFARRVAVVLANDKGGDIYAMKLPAMSIFGDAAQNGYMPFQAYATFLRANKAPMPAVVTEMRFDTSAAVPKLMFKPVSQIAEAEVPIIQAQMARDEVKRATELRVVTKEIPGAPVAVAPAVAPTPAPVAAPAPTVAAPAPAAASVLANAVQDWGADE